MRNPLILGNWKLNGNKKTIKYLINTIKKEIYDLKSCDVVVAPPMVYLDFVHHLLKKSRISLGAQNVDVHLSGSFTGETSIDMLIDLGVKYVIIGHSERRKFHNETDQYIAEKFSIIKQAGLKPIFCIGETKQVDKPDYAKSICIRQINTIFDYLGNKAFSESIIAYEPIWAIGSGIHADPKHVQFVHECIREHIDKYDSNIAKSISIQYGGSINIDNVYELFSCKDVDGALIGKSSLDAVSFIKIVKEINKIKNNIF